MPLDITNLRIVVASPSDVKKERETVDRVAAELNMGLARELGLVLTITKWETAVFPGFHRHGPQGLIDEVLRIPDCDIFIGIFWTGFGTATEDSPSGTAHEFNVAYEAWRASSKPAIWFYFNEKPYSPKSTAELKQWQQVLEFKKAFPQEGLWWVYQGSTSFRHLIRQHLTRYLVQTRKGPSGTHPTAEKARDEVAARIPRSKGFRGRATELLRLKRHLENTDVSIVVVEGISGIGKSALAKHFASRIASTTYDCFWYDCRSETTLDFLTWELAKFARKHNYEVAARIFEEPYSAERERVVQLADVLSEQPIAIFLDNYHLVTDIAVDKFLEAFEDRSTRAKVFLIARRRPAVLERIRSVAFVEEHLKRGLDVISCSEFLRDCGVEMESETANAVWKLTGEGHPKALQLFVWRAKRIPIQQLLSTLPVFREDLMHDWLLPMLSELGEDERTILINLSVFDRPIAFAAVSALFPEKQTENLLVSLLERFLLDATSEAALEMHLLVREYCYELLTDKPSKHLWAADYYREKCGNINDPDFVTDEQMDSLLAAWSHYLSAGDQEKATEVVDILRPPLMNRGNYDQVLQLLEKTLPSDPIDAEFFVIHKARLMSLRGEADAALAMIVPLLHSQNDRTVREAVLVISWIYNESRRASEAISVLEGHWRLFTGPVSNRVKTRFLLRLVQAHLEVGNAEQALEWATKLCRSSELGGDKVSGAIALRQMGASYISQKKLATALQVTQLSRDLLQESGRIRESAISSLQEASIHEQLGDTPAAVDVLEKALATFLGLADRKHITDCRQSLARLGGTARAAQQ
jgi:ATP/maltotriose-dependent transcriptional regulator MalT